MNELPKKAQDALDTLKTMSFQESDFYAPINFYKENADYQEAVTALEIAVRQMVQREYVAKEDVRALLANHSIRDYGDKPVFTPEIKAVIDDLDNLPILGKEEVPEITAEEAAVITGYKCPICRHYRLCHTPMLAPKCGDSYDHFEPKED